MKGVLDNMRNLSFQNFTEKMNKAKKEYHKALESHSNDNNDMEVQNLKELRRVLDWDHDKFKQTAKIILDGFNAMEFVKEIDAKTQYQLENPKTRSDKKTPGITIEQLQDRFTSGEKYLISYNIDKIHIQDQDHAKKFIVMGNENPNSKKRRTNNSTCIY